MVDGAAQPCLQVTNAESVLAEKLHTKALQQERPGMHKGAELLVPRTYDVGSVDVNMLVLIRQEVERSQVISV